MNDSALHAAIRDAVAAGRVTVEVNYGRANRSGAPGFRTTDIVVPWFCAGAVSIYLGATYGVIVGAAMFVILAALIQVLVRPYNRRQAEERYRRLSLAQLVLWEALCRLGALALRRPGPDDQVVAAPDGDWRAVARAFAGVTR